MPGGRAGVYNATLTGDWGRLGAAFATLSVRFPQAMQQALYEEGAFYRTKIVEGIREQAPGGVRFKPLSPLTIALRKLAGFHGTKALIRTGELRNNVRDVPVGKDAVFVGITYTARGADGRNLADIGRLMEYGGVVRASISKRRMRAIAVMLRKAGKLGSGGGKHRIKGTHAGFGLVRIPARPFIGPTFEMYGGKRGAERYMARVARKLGGLLGVIGHPDLGGRGVETIPERLVGGSVGAGSRGLRQAIQNGSGGMSATKARTAGKSFMKSLGKIAPPVGRVVRRTSPHVARTSRGARPRIAKPRKSTALQKLPRLRVPRAPRPRKIRFTKKLIGTRKMYKPKRTRPPKLRMKRQSHKQMFNKTRLRIPQHNAHVLARRRHLAAAAGPQHNAHVKAHKKQFPQHSAHVKVHKQMMKRVHVKPPRISKYDAHVKARTQHFKVTRHDAHVKARGRHRSSERRKSKGK